MRNEVPIRTVKGPEEVTVWVWPHSPDPVVVRIDRETWEQVRKRSDREYGGSVARLIMEKLEEDLRRSNL